MWCVLMVVFLIFPHELFVELFSSWFGDIRRLHVGVPQPNYLNTNTNTTKEGLRKSDNDEFVKVGLV